MVRDETHNASNIHSEIGAWTATFYRFQIVHSVYHQGRLNLLLLFGLLCIIMIDRLFDGPQLNDICYHPVISFWTLNIGYNWSPLVIATILFLHKFIWLIRQ